MGIEECTAAQAAAFKCVDEFLGQPFDHLITGCDRARQTCLVLPGSENMLRWSLDDLAKVVATGAKTLEAFGGPRWS